MPPYVFRFSEEGFEDGLAPTQRFLYIVPEYLHLHTAHRFLYCTLEDTSAAVTVVSAVVSLEGTEVAFAPFGGIQLHSDEVAFTALSTFFSAVEQQLYERGVRQLYLTPPPAIYLPTALPLDFWQHMGYRLTHEQTLHYIAVTAEQTLRERVIPAHRRRLRKCREAGLIAEEWKDFCPQTVYAWIAERRAEKGYPLSLSYEKFLSLRARFPERYVVFRVLDGTQLAALSVSVRVGPSQLYHYLPAYSPSYTTYSPMILLTEALYDYCRTHQIQLLDLGTSVDAAGHEKPSLARFKRNLGALECPKLSFKKTLTEAAGGTAE